jgi:hypothetical protein
MKILCFRIFIIFISIISICTAHAIENIDQYYSDIAAGRLERPYLKIANSLVTTNKKKATQTFFKIRENINLKNAKLIDLKYENNFPAFYVEHDQKRYRISFESAKEHNYVVKTILRELGFNTGQTFKFNSLSINLNNFNILDVTKFWNNSPLKIPFEKYLEKNLSSETKTLTINTAFVEEIPEQSMNLKTSILSDKDFQIALMWLQCDQINETLTSFKYCLGNSVAVSSPNNFQNQWLDIQLGNESKFKNFILDKEIRKASIRLNKNDFLNFYSKINSFNLNSLVDLFSDSGYPVSLSFLYSAKLKNRIAELGRALGIENTVSKEELCSIEDNPYIVHGQFKKNYPNFEADFTESNYTSILFDKLDKDFDSITSLAKHMLATFPYTAPEIGKIGQSKLALGFVFRIKREVIENYKPTGPKDRYLVKDSIIFQINLGLGAYVDTKLANGYISAAPGFVKNYIYVRGVSSLEEAKNTYWSISKDIVIKSDYANLKENEILAIESGFSASLIAGGGLFTGIPKTKPQGYLMDSLQFLKTFQVEKLSNGKLVIVASNDIKNDISMKLFIKLLIKLARIPFANFSQVNGLGKQDVFIIDPLNDPHWNQQNQNSLASAFQLADADLLRRYFSSKIIKTDYSWTSWFLNLYFFEVHGESNKTTIEQSEDNISKKFYTLTSRKNYETLRSDRVTTDEGCVFSSIVETQNASDLKAIDAALIFRCEIVVKGIGKENTQKKIEQLAETLNLSISQKNELRKVVTEISKHRKLLLSGSVSGSDLLFLLNRKVYTQQDFENFLKEFNIDQNLQVQSLADLNRRNKIFALNLNLFQLVAKKSAGERIALLTKYLSEYSVGDDFKSALLPSFKNLSYELKIANDEDIELSGSKAIFEKEAVSSSEALDYLKNRVLFNQKNVFDSL